jgi:hypothetical protein
MPIYLKIWVKQKFSPKHNLSKLKRVKSTGSLFQSFFF